MLKDICLMVFELTLFKLAVAGGCVYGLVLFIIGICSNSEKNLSSKFFSSLLLGGGTALAISVIAFIFFFIILIAGSLLLGMIGGILGIVL